jgi:hypothetical protein
MTLKHEKNQASVTFAMVRVIVTSPYHDTNQCCDLLAQSSKLHEDPSYVSYCRC